jgi:hypothetical protein
VLAAGGDRDSKAARSSTSANAAAQDGAEPAERPRSTSIPAAAQESADVVITALMQERRMTSYRLLTSESATATSLHSCALRAEAGAGVTDFGGGVNRLPSGAAQRGWARSVPRKMASTTQTAPILLRLGERYGCSAQQQQRVFEVLRWLFWDNR